MTITHLWQSVADVSRGIIVHGVNCQNAMGSGVAKALSDKWPEVKRQYHKVMNVLLSTNSPGELLGNSHVFLVDVDTYVMNGWTQEFYGREPGRRYASPSAIDTVVGNAFAFADGMDLPLYMPKIGSGLGGLSWDEDVNPIVEKWAEAFPNVQAFVCDIK